MWFVYFSDEKQNLEDKDMSQTKHSDDVHFPESVNTEERDGADKSVTSKNLQMFTSDIINLI